MENQKAVLSVPESNFALNLCEKLHTFRLDRCFSDICIRTSDDVQFHAHKLITSASSEYFMAMFASNMRESSANDVQLHNVTAKDFQPIITFLYTGKIKFEGGNVEEILRTANFFQISALITQCHYFMGMNKLLDTENWFNISLCAHQHKLTDLFEKLIKFANENSEAIFDKEEFLSLADDLIYAIVSHKELNVKSEEKLFLSLIRWMEYDRQNREKKALKLFTAIRYWRLTADFIKQEKSKLPDEVEYLKMICSWFEWHSLPAGLRPEFNPTENSQGLFLFGNQKLQYYNEKLNTWTVRRIPNLPRNHVGEVIAFKNKLIFSETWGSLHVLDLLTEQVTPLPPIEDISRYSMAIFENELYLMSVSEDKLRWCRKFNFGSTKREWSSFYSLHLSFANVQTAVVNSSIYIYLKKKLVVQISPDFKKITTLPVLIDEDYSYTLVA